MSEEIFTFFLGIILGVGIALMFIGDKYHDGAIAATKGEVICKEIEQFSKPSEWQCKSVETGETND